MKPLMKYHCSIQTQDKGVIETWGVYPILATSKILDGIYDPESKNLKLIFDSSIERMVPVPIQKANGKYENQIRKMEQYYDGLINTEDIPFFLETYVDNNFEFKEKGLIIVDEQK